MVQITKPTGSIFVHNIPKWLTYFASYLNEVAHFKHWIAWDAMGAPLGKTLLPNHYGIFMVYPDKYPHTPGNDRDPDNDNNAYVEMKDFPLWAWKDKGCSKTRI